MMDIVDEGTSRRWGRSLRGRASCSDTRARRASIATAVREALLAGAEAWAAPPVDAPTVRVGDRRRRPAHQVPRHQREADGELYCRWQNPKARIVRWCARAAIARWVGGQGIVRARPAHALIREELREPLSVPRREGPAVRSGWSADGRGGPLLSVAGLTVWWPTTSTAAPRIAPMATPPPSRAALMRQEPLRWYGTVAAWLLARVGSSDSLLSRRRVPTSVLHLVVVPRWCSGPCWRLSSRRRASVSRRRCAAVRVATSCMGFSSGGSSGAKATSPKTRALGDRGVAPAVGRDVEDQVAVAARDDLARAAAVFRLARASRCRPPPGRGKPPSFHRKRSVASRPTYHCCRRRTPPPAPLLS